MMVEMRAVSMYQHMGGMIHIDSVMKHEVRRRAAITFQACPPQGVRPKTDRTEHGTEPIEPKPSAPTNQPGSTTRCDTYIDRTEPTKCRRSRVSTEPIEPNISTFRISIEPIADKLEKSAHKIET